MEKNMDRSIPEKDWKQLNEFKPEMLNALCLRINRKAEKILQSPEKSEHEKYLALFRHLKRADYIVARCFDDWSRGTIRTKISQLLYDGLLTDGHIQHLSDETKEMVEGLISPEY